MKAVLIIFMYFTGVGSSEQIEYPDLDSCNAAIAGLPGGWTAGVPNLLAFCVEVPK